jgi:hypothetical protein
VAAQLREHGRLRNAAGTFNLAYRLDFDVEMLNDDWQRCVPRIGAHMCALEVAAQKHGDCWYVYLLHCLCE